MSRCRRFFPVFGDKWGTAPGDERSGAVRRTDRGFLVSIPDQRPSQRRAPEIPNLPRPHSTVDRSETPATGEELVLRLDDAELVAFGVGEHDMTLVWALTDEDVGAELDQSRDRLLLVIDGRGRQIEMEPVPLRRLPLRDLREVDPESRSIGRREANLILGLVVYLPTQGSRPEARETERIVRIEAESDEPRSRSALYHLNCQVMPVGVQAHDRTALTSHLPPSPRQI